MDPSTDQDSLLDLSFNDPQSNEINELTLVGKFITNKTVNFKATLSIITNAWNLGSNVELKAIERNTITYTFRHKEDRDKVLASGPWAVKGALLNLKQWKANHILEEIDFAHIPLWI